MFEKSTRQVFGKELGRKQGCSVGRALVKEVVGLGHLLLCHVSNTSRRLSVELAVEQGTYT